MYQPTIPVLWTDIQIEGFRSGLTYLYSNGTYLRWNDGRLFARCDSEIDEKVYFIDECDEKTSAGAIIDKVLVRRLKTYWNDYLGKYYTNCSAFANYLTTGNFVECKEELGLLVISQGMRPYEMASRIDVGDMVCLMYAHDKYAKSRRNKYLNRYLRVKKHRQSGSSFVGAAEMQLHQRSFTASEIRELFNLFWIRDYHFMVCVAKRDGRPVWLSQVGRTPPKDEHYAFAITYDNQDPYHFDTPVFALIKKRR